MKLFFGVPGMAIVASAMVESTPSSHSPRTTCHHTTLIDQVEWLEVVSVRENKRMNNCSHKHFDTNKPILQSLGNGL